MKIPLIASLLTLLLCLSGICFASGVAVTHTEATTHTRVSISTATARLISWSSDHRRTIGISKEVRAVTEL